MTSRQALFLADYASGANLRDLAKQYYYTYGGIVWHFKEIKRKLDADSITHACVIAMTAGIISHPTGATQHCVPMR